MYNKLFMNYYTLPKINNIITIKPNKSSCEMKPCISQTLINYYNELKNNINILCENINLNNHSKSQQNNVQKLDNIINYNYNYSYNNIDYNEVIKLVNPHEYIFSKVPSSNFSVSKLKPKSIMFYDLLEMFKTLNLLDSFNFDIMNSLIIGENYEDSLECLEILRENHNDDKFFCFYEYNLKLYSLIEKTKFNFIIYETNNCENINQYVIKLIELLLIILNHLKENSIIILKINNIYYKPIIEILYIFCSFFEKTHIIKPNTSNIITSDKYIILQNLKLNHYSFEIINNYIVSLNRFIVENTSNDNNSSDNDFKIHNIIDSKIPYFFLNKIDDINIIIGQQQLDLLNQIINILKSKNKEEKLETLKKNNIQRCVNWCEKFKIPYNKFSDKINIFLPNN